MNEVKVTAFLGGYLSKEAAPKTVGEYLERYKDDKPDSLFWTGAGDSGETEALLESAEGKDPGFNVKHPILSDIGSSLGGTFLGMGTGAVAGSALSGDKEGTIIGAGLGGAVGGLGALLLARALRYRSMDKRKNDKIDKEKLRELIKEHASGGKVTAGIGSFLLPSYGFNRSGQTKVLERLSGKEPEGTLDGPAQVIGTAGGLASNAAGLRVNPLWPVAGAYSAYANARSIDKARNLLRDA